MIERITRSRPVASSSLLRVFRAAARFAEAVRAPIKEGSILVDRALASEVLKDGKFMTAKNPWTMPADVQAALTTAAATAASSNLEDDDSELLRVAAQHFASSEHAVALMTAAASVEDTRILWVNDAFVRLTGFAVKDVVGQTSKLLAGAKIDPIHVSEVDMLRDHPENARFGIVATKQRPDHSWYNVEEHLIPIRGHANRITHHVLVQLALTKPTA